MNSNEGCFEISIMKVSQPIGDFYVSVIPWSVAYYLWKEDVRQLIREFIAEDGSISREFKGVQRHVDEKRSKEIREYVRSIDACFPNTIIMTIPSEYVKDITPTTIIIEKCEEIATIIDGQHRLSGFENYINGQFDLIVTLFIDMDFEQQAYLFSIINTKQTRMNPSLEKDLYELSTIETPEKVLHNIAKSMNEDTEGPWYNEIKMLGKNEKKQTGYITQHTFVSGALGLIYPHEYQNNIRSTLKRHKNNRDKLWNIPIDGKKYPLWSFYVKGQDNVIRKTLDNYFSAIKSTFNEEWVDDRSIIRKTTGFNAFIKELKILIPLGKDEGSLSKDFFTKYLLEARQRLEASGKRMTAEEFGLGNAASERLRRLLFGHDE